MFVPEEQRVEDKDASRAATRNGEGEGKTLKLGDPHDLILGHEEPIANRCQAALMDNNEPVQVNPDFVQNYFLERQTKAERMGEKVWWDPELWKPKDAYAHQPRAVRRRKTVVP